LVGGEGRTGQWVPTPQATILRIGKSNNVVHWKEVIQNELTELYGLTTMFFTTIERYVQPFPREEGYIPDCPDSDDEEEPPALFDAEGEPMNLLDIAAQTVAREEADNARREVRRRANDKQVLNFVEEISKRGEKRWKLKERTNVRRGAVYGGKCLCPRRAE
jgi:hypothetical protein